MTRVYLDHAATTPCRSDVIDAMVPYLGERGYNPSSLHAEGRAARAALDAARRRVAAALGATPREIVFTGGGSEADTLAIIGAAHARSDRGRHAVTVATEHHAVLRSFEALEEEGWSVTRLGVDERGRVDPASFADALRDDTAIASVMLANNEIGTIAPIAELAALARARGVLFHTDAVQGTGYLPIDVAELGVDLLAISAHKFYGPKGVGALYVRAGTPLAALVLGGGQEFGLRSGTENLAGIVGLATALDLAVAERPATATRVRALRDRLEAGILANIPGAAVNGAGAPRLPNNCNVSFPGVDGEALLIALDLAGIAVSAGSACTAGATVRSHVIAALSPAEDGAGERRGVVRFSLGRDTTAEQVESVLACLPGMVANMREFPAFVGTT
jgi:cysteine desulfurase